MISVGIVGGTGYTGVELLRLLLRHPNVQVSVLTSRTEDGRRVDDMFPSLRGHTELKYSDLNIDELKKCDVVFFATPHGVAMKHAEELGAANTKVIDLAADFRLQDLEQFEKWYGMQHACPELLKDSVYGLSELNREQIKQANVIGNPGCYPTTVQLGLAPLFKQNDTLVKPESIIIDAKSGTTGAGRGAKVPNLYCEVNENMKAYGVATHRHTPEIEEQLGYASGKEVVINFTPHLVPMNRGILATEYAKLTKDVTWEEVKAVYDKYYANEKFVRVLEKDVYPETKWVEGSNYVDIGFKIDPRTNRIIMMGAIDNLVKGAAGQAVQNMNLIFGLPESEGLDLVPMFP